MAAESIIFLGSNNVIFKVFDDSFDIFDSLSRRMRVNVFKNSKYL